MSPVPLRAALRELALATAHATCDAPEALDSALEHAERAVVELQEVRRARHVAGRIHVVKREG